MKKTMCIVVLAFCMLFTSFLYLDKRAELEITKAHNKMEKSLMEDELDMTKRFLDNERKCNDRLLDEIDRLRLQLDEKAIHIEHLKEEIKERENKIPNIKEDLPGLYIPETYVVKEGDWLSTIALKYYGDIEMWKYIWALNKLTIDDPDIIYPGQVIFLR